MIELTTQCPQCQHQFDVTLEQLQQRKGLLRCPRCAQIFDAYECAVAKTQAAPSVSPITEPVILTPTPSPTPTPSATPGSSKPPSFSISAAASDSESESQSHFISQPASAPIAEGPQIKTRAQTAAAIRSSQPIQSATESDQDIRVYLSQDGRPEPRWQAQPDTSVPHFSAEPRRVVALDEPSSTDHGWSRPLWVLLVWVLVVMTALQLLYVYRAQIANTVSFTRPVLQRLCDGLGCTIPYMRTVEAIEIRQSSLQQQPNFEQKGQYAYLLQLQLKNTLAWAQEWPTLVVSFTDASAAALATLPIEPQQYLAPSQRQRPFEPGAQLTIRLPVLLPNKKINGFTVEKYYP